MKIAYVEAVGGASGDMILGALVDAGLPIEALRTDLSRLPLGGWTLEAAKVHRGTIAATQVTVRTGEGEVERHLRDLLALLDGADLPGAVLDRSRAILQRIAEAEAAIHGEPVERVHLHELGGVDTVLDVVGAVAGFHRLGVERIHVAPLPLAHGTTESRHGTIPLPAPATLALLRGAPVRVMTGLEAELVTPTGAAVLAGLADGFGGCPLMHLGRVGHGAGSRELSIPNVLRLWLGETQAPLDMMVETLVNLKTNIDDMPAHRLAHVMDRLLARGALDVSLLPLCMKKNRVGTLVSVICREEDAERLTRHMLEETTTLGVRRQAFERLSLPREIVRVDTPHGPVRVKVARLGSGVKMSAEFEDCRALADASGLPLEEIERAALEAARQTWKGEA